jgi:hypothetical protein
VYQPSPAQCVCVCVCVCSCNINKCNRSAIVQCLRTQTARSIPCAAYHIQPLSHPPGAHLFLLIMVCASTYVQSHTVRSSPIRNPIRLQTAPDLSALLCAALRCSALLCSAPPRSALRSTLCALLYSLRSTLYAPRSTLYRPQLSTLRHGFRCAESDPPANKPNSP